MMMNFEQWREAVLSGLKAEGMAADSLKEFEDSIKQYFEEGLAPSLAVGVIYSDYFDPDEDEDDDEILEVAEEDSLEDLAQPQDDEDTIEESKKHPPTKKRKGSRKTLSLNEQIKLAEERGKKAE
ncbi:MAG: hypothetical protein QNL04_00070 [SAR324 cluster bacterium]|nr:hypothetical protein [SAR324 cluster bacterium]